MSSTSNHILVIPFHGQGHLFPSIELCKRLSSSLNYKITLIVPSTVSSSLPHHHPTFHVSLLPPPPPPPPPPESDSFHHHHRRSDLTQPLTDHLSHLFNGSDPPTCAIIDVMVHWAHQPCQNLNISTISFFTSSACSASFELAIGKLSPDNSTRGESFLLPGLPEHVRVNPTDLTNWTRPPPKFGLGPPPPGPRGGPPFKHGPGNPPPWALQTESSVALIINTCDDLERPFIDYLIKEVGKPIFGLGPLLPEEFSTVGSTVHDRDLRSNHDQSNLAEDEVNQWLDTKPRGSVLYVSFGSEVGPTLDELAELANALDESNRPFIWVIQSESKQPGSHGGPSVVATANMDFLTDGFVERVKGRGLIIHGWAPQLLILSHRSTGGFVSHGGWNSTVEAILRGVPLLMWPIRGDQHYNAKLIVDHLKIGLMIQVNGDRIERLRKDDILKGIQKLMVEEDVKKRAVSLANVFVLGFSPSYKGSLNAFSNFVNEIPKVE